MTAHLRNCSGGGDTAKTVTLAVTLQPSTAVAAAATTTTIHIYTMYYTLYTIYYYILAWWRGVVVSGVGLINEVN